MAGGVLLLAVMAVLGWRWLSKPQATTPAAPAIRTVRAWTGVVEETIRLTGVTDSENAVSLIVPRLGGSRSRSSSGSSRSTSHDYNLTLDFLIPGGTQVKKGDLVASFDRQYMLNRLDDYRAVVMQHEANLRSLRAALDVRRRSYEQRLRAAKGNVEKAELNLKTAPVRSAMQVERYRLALEEAKARYKELQVEVKYFDISEAASMRRSELDLQETRLGLKRAEANLNVMVVHAPIDGLTVTESTHRGMETGEIKQGDELRAGHRFLQIVDSRSMIVRAAANQSDAEVLRLGQKASVHFDAFPGLALPARVTSIGAFAITTGYRTAYLKQLPVRLKLLELDPRVIPNFTVGADVVLNTSPKTTIIPRESIFYEGSPARPVAYVRSGDKWQKRELELGLKNYVAAAVLSGVKAGEVLAAELPPQAQ